MQNFGLYRYASQRIYFLFFPLVPNPWVRLQSDTKGEAWEAKPVQDSEVPDRGTMVREYYRNALPEEAQNTVTAFLTGELWTVRQPASMREQPATATLCLFNASTGEHSSYPYVSGSQAIEDARNFTRENPNLRAQVLARTILKQADGGSTRVWTLSGGQCLGSYDLLDAGGVFGMQESRRARTRRRETTPKAETCGLCGQPCEPEDKGVHTYCAAAENAQDKYAE